MAAARAYFQHPRTELVGLCDLIPERLEALGDELGVAACYEDLDRMITAEAPDIVAIPTGTEFHHELALRVLEHGVHIDIEKPSCTTLAEADEVQSIAMHQPFLDAVSDLDHVDVATWPGADHGYTWPGYPTYDEGDAEGSWARTLAMFDAAFG